MPAQGQTTYVGTVDSVTTGDALTARLADGRQIAARLIGIDAPDVTDCGGADARDALDELANGQAIELETDPSVPPLDGDGRSWFYVDRADGVDVGLAMVRRGWARVLDGQDFLRRSIYSDAQSEAFGGVWAACDGDFHLTRAEQLRERRDSAKAFVRRYYRHLSNNRFRSAWRMLGAPVKRKLKHNFHGWKAGYRRSLSTEVLAAKARLKGRRAVVRVRLRSRDRDVCDGRIMRQYFRGNLTLAPRGDEWRVVKLRITKTRGGNPRLSKSECPPPPPPAGGGGGGDCQGYDPCIGPGSDVDCLGGSGNGPRYVDGPVYINGSDPYDLDSDGDGVGCED